MSIFLEQHHNALLLEYLSIDDIARLSQVNRYYYKLMKDKLQSFSEFFKIKDTLNEEIYYSPYYMKLNIHNDKYIDKALKLTIQSHLYGNLEVIKYIASKTERFSWLTHVSLQRFERSCTLLDKNYQYIDTILTMIAISKKRIDVLLYLKDLYGFTDICVPISREYLGDASVNIAKILKDGGCVYADHHIS